MCRKSVIVAACNAETSFRPTVVFLWVTQATKSKFAARISERGRQNGSKFCR